MNKFLLENNEIDNEEIKNISLANISRFCYSMKKILMNENFKKNVKKK
jgi:hypothetical protein